MGRSTAFAAPQLDERQMRRELAQLAAFAQHSMISDGEGELIYRDDPDSAARAELRELICRHRAQLPLTRVAYAEAMHVIERHGAAEGYAAFLLRAEQERWGCWGLWPSPEDRGRPDAV